MTQLGSRPDSTSASVQVAPPREPATHIRRTGYVLLAASGVVVSTAFAAIAALAGPGAPAASPDNPRGSHNSGQVIPGRPLPGQDTLTISGAAVEGSLSSSATPTTSVSVGPDGKPTTTTLSNSQTTSDTSESSETSDESTSSSSTTTPRDDHSTTPSSTTSSSKPPSSTSPPPSSSSSSSASSTADSPTSGA